MTVLEIQVRLREAGKPMTRRGLYNHFKALKLKPTGVARPAIYPEDSADKIIKRLGLPVLKPARKRRAA